MKVLTKVVIDIETGRVLEQESYEYDGPVAMCDFGGGRVDRGYKALARAYERAAETMNQMFEMSARMADPWRMTGQSALGQLSAFMGLGYRPPAPSTFDELKHGIVKTTPAYTGPASQTEMLKSWPGYQWAVEQGREALERSAAARGMGLSGAALRGITEFGQQAAVEKALVPYLNVLGMLSGTGQATAVETGRQALGAGQAIGSSLVGAGQAQLAGAIERANQQAAFWNSLLGGLGMLGGGLLGVFGKQVFGTPSRQTGGPVAPGVPYLVGESGPELFVPTEPGYIVPGPLDMLTTLEVA